MTELQTTHELSLSVSCVYFDTQVDIFNKTLETLVQAISHAKKINRISNCVVHLINNNIKQEEAFLSIAQKFTNNFDKLIIHTGHGNIGYGRGNNLAILQTNSDYHLILNPDVYQHEDALSLGIKTLNEDPNIGLVAPSVTNQLGEIEYLAKRTPTLLVLTLRAINNAILNRWFRKSLELYAYKDKTPNEFFFEIELASGCFMLCKTEVLKKVGGFSEKYFLYFEDFDLSKKMAQHTKLIYNSAVKIVHCGGYSSRKGFKHIIYFYSSYLRFRFCN